MDLKNPLVIEFRSGNGPVNVNNQYVQVPVNTNWQDFKQNITSSFRNPNIDYAVISFKGLNDRELNDPNVIKSLDIQTKTIIKTADTNGLRVFNRFQEQLYFLNPSFDELKLGNNFVPADSDVLNKRDAFDDYSWQKHQAQILRKFAVMMPLTSGKPFEKTNHKEQLMDPSRGLSGEQLNDFFSWQAGKVVIPGLIGDNMVGIPSIKATTFDDLHLFVNDKPVPTSPMTLKTVGLPGIMIPMKNPHGDSPKYQIAADISPINITLKARASDGISIQKSEFFDKKSGKFGEYLFTIDGSPSHLSVVDADNNEVTLEDIKGSFKVPLKKDMKPILEGRGYELPPLIDKLQPVANAKYIWMSPGNMVGSPAINNSKSADNNRIAPSMAGFITAREPRNGSDEYVVVVAEGALKGIITANYLTSTDANGNSVADFIAGDRGIIVSQVPGVAESFVKSVDRIYSEHNVIGTYIAMDADGRDNLAVAKGIHSAFKELSQHSPVKVMSWDPKQKGIDDALLAISQHKITVEDMDIHFGKPETLFPLDKAEAPNPYKLDGTRANKQAWVDEYQESIDKRKKTITEAQATSTTNVQLSLDGLEDTNDLIK